MSQDTFMEDKKCRLCGHADSENEHIFEARDRNLIKKIATVYSIWVTFHDPLPKCICPKCYAKVVSSYKNISQVKKLQTKWIENVQSTEPNNNYIEVLGFVERANVAMKNFIQTNYGERLQKDAIENLLISALSDWKQPPSTAAQEKSTDGSFSFIATSSETNTDNENEEQKTENEDEVDYFPLEKRAKLSTTPTIVKCKYCALKFESLKELAAHQIVHLQLSLPKLFEPKCLDKNFRRGRLISVQSRQSIRCLNCYLVFDDNKCILEHWSKAECDFYCQICGEEFAQSPKLLRDHISEVHGISYRSLKMQRDLAYLNNPPKPQIVNKPKQKVEAPAIPKANIVNIKPKVINTNLFFNQPPHTNGIEVSSSTFTGTVVHMQTPLIKCRICNRDFRNFKACNSHMRAHKPPYAYNDTELLPEMNTDAYMEPEPMNYLQISTTSPRLNRPQPSTSTCTNNFPHISTPIPTTAANTLTSTPYDSNLNLNLNNIIPKKEIEMDVEQENPQINFNDNNNSTAAIASTSNNSNNNNALPHLFTTNTTTATKPPTSTAPRGIRMKFVSRRSDLNINGTNASIKVKSLNDLQNLQTNQMLQNLQHIKTPQPTNEIQQHATIIVNNVQQPQELQPQQQQTPLPVPTLNTLEPKHEASLQMPSFIKDEPMEFI